MPTDPRRNLPSVDAVLAALGSRAEPHDLVVAAIRDQLQEARKATPNGTQPTAAEMALSTSQSLDSKSRPSLQRVINASGVILQTNLGRAPLSQKALAAMAEVAAASNLEYDLEAAVRGSRHEHVRKLLQQTTGAEDGIAVNNNAAALFMVLQAFCRGREVIVSRGQAVEIGGGFRIPDVLRESGATLIEVGTTNRTYARDYEAAIGPNTAAILRVHASNFKVVGFTTEPTSNELAEVAHRNGALLIDDLGSGCLVDTRDYGLEHEPTVQESLSSGVDLALFSGDKLLGGPQAGIIVGRRELIADLRRHPLARALRLDKFGIAGLNATLHSYLMHREASEVPIWQMLRMEPSSLRARARKWARLAGDDSAVIPSRTMVGGGSLPGQGVDTFATALSASWGAEETARRLRAAPVPVIGRISNDLVLLDPRTVLPADDAMVGDAIASAFRQSDHL
ncbi:MAG: L-seryl-tRNA(Sec) selenium transferase [bacterium]